MTGLMFPKPRPKALERKDRDAAKGKINRRESAKVKARSHGQCEVYLRGRTPYGKPSYRRCARRAMPGTHHLIFGIGRRNVGKSILAEHRIAICRQCHDDIGKKILVPLGTPEQRESAATVVYERRA